MARVALPADAEFYTVSEVASYLRVAKMTVYRMVEEGLMPHKRLGRTIRIPAEDFAKMMEEAG